MISNVLFSSFKMSVFLVLFTNYRKIKRIFYSNMSVFSRQKQDEFIIFVLITMRFSKNRKKTAQKTRSKHNNSIFYHFLPSLIFLPTKSPPKNTLNFAPKYPKSQKAITNPTALIRQADAIHPKNKSRRTFKPKVRFRSF